MTATLPAGLLGKTLASAQQATSTPQAGRDASQGKASWWGAIGALFSGAIIGAVSLITIAGSHIEAAVPPVAPAPAIEQPVSISVEDVPMELPPEPDSTTVQGKRLVEREDGLVLESDFEKKLDQLPRKSRGHYLDYLKMKNLDEKDLDQLHTILKNDNFPLWEVDARAQMMNSQKRDYRPLFEGLGRIFLDEAKAPFVEDSTPKDYSGDLGLIKANPTHIHQLFSNLIVNAVRHCDSPQPRIEISLLGTEPGGGMRYLVRDNGSGIPHELLDRLFSPFVKREGGGSGTGLAIVDKIVKIYNGSIKAYNDNGAFFEFILYDYQRSPVPEQEEG